MIFLTYHYLTSRQKMSSEINFTVVKTVTLVKSFYSESEAKRWIENQRPVDLERKKTNNVEIHYEIWHPPVQPASKSTEK